MLIPELCEQETDVTSSCMSIRGWLISLFQGRRGSWLLEIKNIWDWCSFVVKITQVMEWTWVQFNQSTIFQVLYWSISISQISTFLNLFIIYRESDRKIRNMLIIDPGVMIEWHRNESFTSGSLILIFRFCSTTLNTSDWLIEEKNSTCNLSKELKNTLYASTTALTLGWVF